MNGPPSNEEDLFAEALALPPGDRARFLDDACRGDPDRRQRIDNLLGAHDAAGSFMQSPPAGEAMPRTAPPGPRTDEPGGDRIGRYKLLQKIGEGGCGVVYMAEQEEPVRRRVALKVIKLGMDTKEVIARFDAERQALALMDHPNIARVFDGGATENGRPFFVMELVRGLPITKFCDEQNLSTTTRLELFTQVCHAVQHAHQKGIIHRDLKPSNILVTQHDGKPVPKVIDFGIAKATAGRLTDATLFTTFQQFIGTPAYMSPEQAELSGLDIDTRSDIYSLGVLLYELLTGRPPFDPQTLLSAGLDEIRRVIREVDPPRPSTRLSTLTDIDRATIAKQRGLAPAQLSTLLRGDLDWIVMRCLEKDRTQRYENASALAADVQRHLHDEPVVARPPGGFYRFKKLVCRHKLLVTSVALVAASLMAGLTVSTWLLLEERQARRRAEAAEKARGTLQDQIIELPRLFYLAGLLEDQGKLAEAEEARRKLLALARAVVGEEDTLVADNLCDLGSVLKRRGKLTEAERYFRESLVMYRKLLDRGMAINHVNVRRVFTNLTAMLGNTSRSQELERYFADFLTPMPEDTAVREPVLRRRAEILHREWRWRELASDLAVIVHDSPDDVQISYQLAALLATTGAQAEYRKHCDTMLGRFAISNDASVLRRVAKAALLLPAEGAQLGTAAAATDRAFTADDNNPWAWFGKGLSEYRHGNFAAAAEWARRVRAAQEHNDQRYVQAELLLAMALHGLGRRDEGRAALHRVHEIANTRLPKPSAGQPPPDDWANAIITTILIREADILFDRSSLATTP